METPGNESTLGNLAEPLAAEVDGELEKTLDGPLAVPVSETSQFAQPPLITIGRTVLYRLSEHDAAKINDRRGANASDPAWPKGAIAHFGNYVKAGDVFPLVVTKVWNDQGTINGQVMLDGNDTLWVTSVTPRPSPGIAGCHWDWPTRV